MYFYINPYVAVMMIPTLMTAILAVLAWRRRSIHPAIQSLAVLMAGVAGWCFSYAVGLASTAPAAKLFWLKVTAICIPIVPVALFVFIMRYTGRWKKRNWSRIILLAAFPALILLLSLTSRYGTFFREALDPVRDSRTAIVLLQQSGWLFWLFWLYIQLLLAGSTGMLLRTVFKQPRLFRGETVPILIAIIAPWAGHLTYIGFSGYIPYDPTPLLFTVTVIATTVAVFNNRFLNILPIAYNTAIKYLKDPIVILDKNNWIVDMNISAMKLANTKRTEIVGRTIGRTLPECEPILPKHPRAVIADKTEIRINDKLFELQVSAFHNKKRRRHGFILQLHDITDRKTTEDALRASEQQYRHLVENINEAIYRMDPQGFITYVSPSVTPLAGYDPRDIVGRSFIEFVPPEDQPMLARKLSRLLAGHTESTETRVYTKTGDVRWVYSSAKTIYQGGTIVYLQGVLTDIHEKKQAEKETEELQKKLARSQKMEALGLLAGGVAHDLNNILSASITYPDMMLTDLPGDSPFIKPLEAILESGQRAAAIVQDLLTLARRGVSDARVIDLNQNVVSAYLSSFQIENFKALYPDVTIETRLSENLRPVEGSAIHLKKTLMNLIINAAEAITEQENGVITVSTENRNLQSSLKGYEIIEKGEYAVLRIEDNGCGIDEKDLERIFEPFYTKKIMGRSGSGLGMTVVWGTIKDHNGFIDIKSKVDNGSIFELYLPVTRKTPETEKHPLPIAQYTGAGEKIMVIDDSEQQRELMARILEKLGYSPITVNGGEAALEWLTEKTETAPDTAKKIPVDLLILDMIMDPGMDGLDTYKEILKRFPPINAIIISGYAENDRIRETIALGASAYIKKPFTLEEFGLAIQKALKLKAS
ncbi:MAG: histidine kinase N-terminal 7TM domain-containing protein [Thermodesulfobacteriota bacterium]|nr:histidine kinase N-terminal 7TM domain-containing protein [Thermodesulfobacteriota bacterium]